jgi:hypothetical protein
VPYISLWLFETDSVGVISTTDLRPIGPTIAAKNHVYDTERNGAVNVIAEDAVTTKEIDRIQQVVDDPERKWAVGLDTDESAEIQVLVHDGEKLAVHRWGAYDGDSGTAPLGLDVELLDQDDIVREKSNTVDEYDLIDPVASLENMTGGPQVFVLRVKNSSGSPIGDSIDERGVGVHFGYIVED